MIKYHIDSFYRILSNVHGIVAYIETMSGIPLIKSSSGQYQTHCCLK